MMAVLETMEAPKNIRTGDHKLNNSFCFSARPGSDASRGRGAFAKKRTRKGTTISVNDSFVSTLIPSQFDRRCNSCFHLKSSVRSMKLSKCSACGTISYCSRECQKRDWKTHKTSCKFVKELYGVIEAAAADNPLGQGLNVDQCFVDLILLSQMLWKLRKFSKNSDTKATEESLHLVDMMQVGDSSSSYVGFLADIANLVKGLLPLNTSTKEVRETLSKFPINNFAIVDDFQKAIGAGVYQIGCILNHSCQPNCVIVYEGTRQIIRTIVDVAEGGEFCHSYVDVFQCRIQRQNTLLSVYGFDCHCDRCLSEDPKRSNYTAMVTLDRSKSGRQYPSCKEVDIRVSSVVDLQRKAQMEEDIKSERALVNSMLKIQEEVLDSNNLELHKTRCWALSLALLDGDLPLAKNLCSTIVKTQERLLEHVFPTHPILQSQRFTLAELEAACGNCQNAKRVLTKCMNGLLVTHGKDSQLYRKAEMYLSSLQ